VGAHLRSGRLRPGGLKSATLLTRNPDRREVLVQRIDPFEVLKAAGELDAGSDAERHDRRAVVLEPEAMLERVTTELGEMTGVEQYARGVERSAGVDLARRYGQ
jgi:hypothetical protein